MHYLTSNTCNNDDDDDDDDDDDNDDNNLHHRGWPINTITCTTKSPSSTMDEENCCMGWSLLGLIQTDSNSIKYLTSYLQYYKAKLYSYIHISTQLKQFVFLLSSSSTDLYSKYLFPSMYTCMYIHIYTCTNACMYTYAHIHAHTYNNH